MKEATVHVNYLSVPDKHQIWFAGKIFLVEPISIAHPMNN